MMLVLNCHVSIRQLMLDATLERNPRSSVQQISTSTGIAPKTVSDLLEQFVIDGNAMCSYDSSDSDPLWTLHLGIPVT